MLDTRYLKNLFALLSLVLVPNSLISYRFVQAQNIISITKDENVIVGSTVHQFTPPTPDQVYSFFPDIASLKARQLFAISNDGIVTTKSSLSYEIGESNSYDLTVLLRGIGETEGGFATTLRITLRDTNNHAPQFSSSFYVGHVLEGPSSGIIVKGLEDVYAEDLDRSGILAYEIVSGNEKGKFTARTKSVGDLKFLVLKTTSPLKRADASAYTLTIQAKDGGTVPKFGLTTVQINVTDANDEVPLFDQPSYDITVNEDTKIMNSVLKVRATDGDLGSNGAVYYLFSSSNQYFSIDAITGVVKVVKVLDYNTIKRVDLTIIARDQGTPSKQSSASVTIKISDVVGYPPVAPSNPGSNNPPRFLDDNYSLRIREDFPIKAAVLIAHAVDNDLPGTNYAKITYSLKSAPSSFRINSESGVISLYRSLDYESNKKFIFEVEARDGGGLTDRASVTIDIQDVDENQVEPSFSKSQDVIQITEGAGTSSIYRAQATDNDSGDDGSIVYSIIGGSGLGYFKIGPSTGSIQPVANLDREKAKQFTLYIEAKDKGTFPKSSRQFLVVNIADKDDMKPQFSQAMYSANVPESRPTATFVTVVRALDQDQSGGDVSYSIITGNSGSSFSMESSTGVIRTLKSLDCDTGIKKYTLGVRATSGTKSSDAQVNIDVTNIDDNSPEFLTSSYSLTVPENQGAILNLICPTAVDKDGADITYSIALGDKSLFSIDKYSGCLSSNFDFDYEAKQKYVLRLEAKSATSTFAGVADVTINVEDGNDPPKFAESNVEINVDETVQPNRELASFNIVDDDTSKSNFICSIEEATIYVHNHFIASNDNGKCKIKTLRTFEYTDEVKQQTFILKATDKNYPKSFAVMNVKVKLVDKNNNKPVFSQSPYWVSVSETAAYGTTIVTVKATDKDTGSFGKVKYELQTNADSSRFEIGEDSGVIKIISSLSANSKYQLKVLAVDGGNQQSSVDVFVSVYGSSISPPTIIQSSSKFLNTLQESFTPSTSSGTHVLRIVAQGPGGSSQGITYSIAGGNIDGAFEIDTSAGYVYVKKKLDFEKIESYSLVLRALYQGSSSGVPALPTDAVGVVNIVDVNDNSPAFAFAVDPVSVVLDSFSPSGTSIIEIQASDKDSSSNGKVKYSIDYATSSPNSNLPFEIDSTTGSITSTQEIRYSSRTQYQIKVKATDEGSSPQSKTMTVKVIVIDIKEPPKFSQQNFQKSIPENSPIGTIVLTAKAVYDIPSTFMKYSIISGNTNNMFNINYKGEITVAGQLDRENIAQYDMKIKVELDGHTDEANVKFVIADVNENAPVFDRLVYVTSVLESAGINTDVMFVTATDTDGGQLTYSILQTVDEGSNNKFEIVPSTGLIKIKNSLDHEDIQEHILTVKVEDNGSPRLKSLAQVRIKVVDINDNNPVFSSAEYKALVPIDAALDTPVLQVSASDMDSGTNGQIRYSIFSGNEQDVFNINDGTGLITVRNYLTTVNTVQYTLIVKAQDRASSAHDATAKVTINIFFRDGPPKFLLDVFTKNITENIAANTLVLTVKAATSETVRYYFIYGNEDEMFKMNPATGQVKTTRVLDYEKKHQYRLRIRAVDMRDRSAEVEYVINVKNINDNKPTFPGMYGGLIEGRVARDTVQGSVVLPLKAYDKDGDSLTFSISPAAARNIFEVDSSGTIRSKTAISDLVSPYSLSVTAKDNGVPSQETTAQVRLVLVNYRPNQQPIRVNIREDETVGSKVTTVPRRFPSGTFGLVFPLVTKFKINSNTGVITLKDNLDYETKKFHSLTVKETAGAYSNNVDVEIHVTDANDNVPKFTMKNMFGKVNTNARSGTVVYQLTAEDPDSGIAGTIGFELVTSSPFTIDPNTHQIKTNGLPITKPWYNITVKAMDYGSPQKISLPVIIRIETGLEKPRFSKNMYRFIVKEESPPGTLIGTADAISLSGLRLSYKIIAGNVQEKLLITSDGKLQVNQKLDYESGPTSFSLVVRAEEQSTADPLQNEVDVEVIVININDNPPFFPTLLYEKTVSEDRGVGTSLFSVVAKDCDCSSTCDCNPMQLLYSTDSNTFAVDPDTGIIKPAKSLDFETTKFHQFTVKVSDKGDPAKTATAEVVVTLTDENDNIPTFNKSSYVVSIAEDALEGSIVTTVIAVDNDAKDTVEYSIIGGNNDNNFEVDKKTGVIRVTHGKTPNLSGDQYTLTVSASDGTYSSNPPTKVYINIEDKNNNKPEFPDCQSLSLSVSEDQPVGTFVHKMTATDKDKGKNGMIEFSLRDQHNTFAIDNTTGEITTLLTLDRETTKSYVLVVSAQDGGHGRDPAERQIGFCQIEIKITDINDNYPVFLNRKYSGSVKENAPTDQSIIQVSAGDPDEGSNAVILYSIKDSGQSVPFTVHQDTGVITPQSSTSTGSFTFTVKAENTVYVVTPQTDQTTKMAETEVSITVTRIDPPKFEKSVYNEDLLESADTNFVVLTVKAIPKQSGKIGIYYAILRTQPDIPFAIGVRSGIIKVGGPLNYEETSSYVLQVEAKDHDTGMFATALVKINLIDVNDYVPLFTLSSYTGRVLENAPIGTPVLTIQASDKDSGPMGQVRYELYDENVPGAYDTKFFSINAITGEISTKAVFNREEKKSYTLPVKAVDLGDQPNVGESYIQVDILDENDEAPFFTQNYTVSIPEDVPVGGSIIEVSASDNDIGGNKILDYIITHGNIGNVFDMITSYGSKNVGILTILSPLDFELRTSYMLRVTATDRKMSAASYIRVTITDVNDNDPVFLKKVYTSSVRENEVSGVPVTKVSATDVDSPDSQLVYSLDSRGKEYFAIDSGTGQIVTANKPLDREKDRVYSFLVYCSDGTRTGKADVVVTVTDINDQSPVFPYPPYIGYVQENQPAGASIIYVTAEDADDPNENGNAVITYVLEDDAGGRFAIDETTGLITSTKPMDRETQPNSFELTVRGTDKGDPSLSGTVKVKVEVTDDNDQKPYFLQKTYRGTVPEDAGPKYVVTTVLAKDNDQGPNAELEYKIVSGNEPYTFFINPHNGKIMVAGNLDYEQKTMYNLTVTVSDRGEPSLDADEPATVLIKVTDANDNPPVFSPSSYQVTLEESEPVGHTLTRLTASDKDSGNNAKFTFSIGSGDDYNQFEVKSDPNDPNIAILTVADPLDYELVQEHVITVAATDSGGLIGFGTVTINLEDVNDNSPEFVPAWYESRIYDNINQRQNVTTLRAKDKDANHGQPFVFNVVNGSENRFVLDPLTKSDTSITMFSLGTFNRLEKPEWKIGVTADDSGTPPRTGSTFVFVDVVDTKNTEEPYDGSQIVLVNAYRGLFKGGEICKAYYKDANYYADVNTYKIDGQSQGDYFSVDPNSGMISVSPDIVMGEYKVEVLVKENKPRAGSNYPKEVTSSSRIIVRSVPEIAVKRSMALRFADFRKLGKFVQNYYDEFQKTISKIFDVGKDDVVIFSIQKSDAGSRSVDVRFSVNDGDSYLLPINMITTVERKRNIFKEIPMDLVSIGIDECAMEAQDVGLCENMLAAYETFMPISGDYGQVVPPSEIFSFVSVNTTLIGRYIPLPDPQPDCSNNPCLNGGTCHNTKPSGYVCECKPEFTGPECQYPTRTFYPDSYLWLTPMVYYERPSLQFEMATKDQNGLLLYQGPAVTGGNNGIKDYFAVMLIGGHIKVSISMGGTPYDLTMDKGPNLNDGKWHHIQVSRDEKLLTITIDRCESGMIVEDDGEVIETKEECEIQGRAKGIFEYVNGLGPLQVGGLSDKNLKYPSLAVKQFKGCIRNIFDNDKMYDLYNPLREYNTKLGCQHMSKCPVCKYEGYCEPRWDGPSFCVCKLGYIGDDCDGRSKSLWYKPASFSSYQIVQKRKRHAYQPPISVTNMLQTHIAMQVRINVEQRDAVLYFASTADGEEYSFLQVKDGVIQYTFKLGDRIKTIGLPEIDIADGLWHNVYVQRIGNKATLQLDYIGKTEGTTGGLKRLVNMIGGVILTGGLPNTTNFFADSPARVVTTTGGVVTIAYTFLSNGYYFLSDGAGGVLWSGTSNNAFGAGGTIEMNEQGDILSKDGVFESSGNIGSWVGGMGTAVGTGTSSGSSVITGAAEDDVGVSGDMTGCTADNRLNGVNMDTDPNVKVVRQNVEDGCPCSAIIVCRNGGVCVDAMIPYCVCMPGFTGRFCGIVVTGPEAGQREGAGGVSRWVGAAIISVILVIMVALMCIMGIVVIARRKKPPVIAVPADDGSTFDNVMPYHDDGAGEEDNFGYDIHYLMKYSYGPTTPILLGSGPGAGMGNGVGGGGGGGGMGMGYGMSGSGEMGKDDQVHETLISVEEGGPLLSSEAVDGPPLREATTATVVKRRVHPDSVDVARFIDGRVHDADCDITWWSVDIIHHYANEGEDIDVDDLSELGSDDEDDEEEQDWAFLDDWGHKFDDLNSIFNKYD